MIPRSAILLCVMSLLGCASTGYARPARTAVEVENQEWQDATVKVYCGVRYIGTVRVPATQTAHARLRLDQPCAMVATVRLLGSPRVLRVSSREMVDREDEVRVVVPHNLAIVWLYLR